MNSFPYYFNELQVLPRPLPEQQGYNTLNHPIPFPFFNSLNPSYSVPTFEHAVTIVPQGSLEINPGQYFFYPFAPTQELLAAAVAPVTFPEKTEQAVDQKKIEYRARKAANQRKYRERHPEYLEKQLIRERAKRAELKVKKAQESDEIKVAAKELLMLQDTRAGQGLTK